MADAELNFNDALTVFLVKYQAPAIAGPGWRARGPRPGAEVEAETA